MSERGVVEVEGAYTPLLMLPTRHVLRGGYLHDVT